ncbi:hypothetical protein [Nocardia terpenica]|nr:hypothetical protein [Nocardia terpenica]NQE92954.1 hypothetical protein [Nocardia terpenica]
MAETDTHRTQIDGLQATWTLDRCPTRIRILTVTDASNNLLAVEFPSGQYPDLAQARTLHPELTKLWDAVRRDLWCELVPRNRPART